MLFIVGLMFTTVSRRDLSSIKLYAQGEEL